MSRVWSVNTLFTDNIYGTFLNSSSVENEVRSRTFILDALSSIFTANKTHTTSHIMHAAMHAARFHDSWPPFCLRGFYLCKIA